MVTRRKNLDASASELILDRAQQVGEGAAVGVHILHVGVELVADVEVVQGGLEHERRPLPADPCGGAGRLQHQLVHLAPGHVVADGDGGGDHHGLGNLAKGKAVIDDRGPQHGGVGDAHHLIAGGAKAGHQQGGVVNDADGAVDADPVAFLIGPGVGEHQPADQVGGHGTRTQGRQHPHEQTGPLEGLAVGPWDVGVGQHDAEQQDGDPHQPGRGPGPFGIEPVQTQVAQFHRPEPGVAGAQQQHREAEDHHHGDQVRDGPRKGLGASHHQAGDLAPQGFREALGGGEQPQEQGDGEVTDQQQNGPVHDPAQGIEEAALLIGGEPLVAPHLQAPDPAVGGVVDPALQAPVQGQLAPQPEDVEAQGEQGQGGAPQPVGAPVGLAVAHDRRADLLQVALGQLLATELEAGRVAVVNRDPGLEHAALHQADGGVRRVLLHDDLPWLDRVVAGQLGQPLAASPRHLRRGLGADASADLQHPSAIQFDEGRLGSALQGSGRGPGRAGIGPDKGGRSQQLGRQQSGQQGQDEARPSGSWAKDPWLGVTHAASSRRPTDPNLPVLAWVCIAGAARRQGCAVVLAASDHQGAGR